MPQLSNFCKSAQTFVGVKDFANSILTDRVTGRVLTLELYGASSTTAPVFTFNSTSAWNFGIGSSRTFAKYTYQFNPSSGTSPLTGFSITPTINQIGSSSGNIIGIDYSPTLTSLQGNHYAALFRSGQVGIGTATPSGLLNVNGQTYIGSGTVKPSALFEGESTTQGVLLPRMTAANRNAISSPAPGLLLNDTDSTYRPFVYTGSAWKGLAYTDETGGGGGSGTVTSVATGYGLTGGTITTTGTLSLDSTVALSRERAANTYWSQYGNTGTVAATNFVGTTDNIPLMFRTNNVKSGELKSDGATFFGYEAGLNNTSVSSMGFGFNALKANVSGTSNTAIGRDALLLNTGSSNTAVGRGALRANLTLGENTAVGAFALTANNGQLNTAIGSSALAANTTGNSNTAIGRGVLSANTTGNENTALGVGSLAANTTGNGSVAIGLNAMAANTSGGSNTAVGYSSLVANTTGSFNSATGLSALAANTTGGSNTAFGHRANQTNQTGNENTAIGRLALSLATSSSNIGLGYQAGDNLTTGGKNIIIGHDIDAPSATTDNQLNIGNIIFGTGVSGTGTTIAGKIGIGVSSPAASSILDVTSTTGGFLMPRMTAANRTAISSPASGLQVYDTDSAGIAMYNGTKWEFIDRNDYVPVAALGSDVTMTTATTWYSGPSISLPAGTWWVQGNITMTNSTSANIQYEARLYDGTTALYSVGSTCPNSGSRVGGYSPGGVVVLTGTTTVTIQGYANQSSGVIRALTPGSSQANATTISAIKIQ